MGIRQIVQKILDDTLITRGILSSHLRRVEADEAKSKNGTKVKINKNIYVVYKIINTRNGFGDGKPVIKKPFIDINVYYLYDKTDARFDKVEAVLKEIKEAFISDGRFTISNDESDIYDFDNPYRGINLEFKFIGAFEEKQNDGGIEIVTEAKNAT